MPPLNHIAKVRKTIRTHFGKLVIPSSDYLVITTLERQKSLRQIERAKLTTQFAAVESRLQFIRSKKTVILCRLAMRPSCRLIENPILKLRAATLPIRAIPKTLRTMH